MEALFIWQSTRRRRGRLRRQTRYKSRMGIITGSALALFIILSLFLYLSRKNILRRVKQCKIELKKQQDLQEILIIQRVRELQSAEREILENVYRLAEFGELASGFFHDLASPLAAIQLRMEELESIKTLTDEMRKHVSQTTIATQRLVEFTKAINKQMLKQETESHFKPRGEVEEAIIALGYKSIALGVQIILLPCQDVIMWGNNFKFYQMMVNLLANALDAYDKIQTQIRKPVEVSINEDQNKIICKIRDYGCGIEPKVLPRIFERFVTTKPAGLGLGLATARRIIQCEFSGDILIASQYGEGTTVTMSFPKMNHPAGKTTVYQTD